MKSRHIEKAPESAKAPEPVKPQPRRVGQMTYAQLVRWCEENKIREIGKRIAIVKG